MSTARQHLPCYDDALYTRGEVLARLPGNDRANRVWLTANVPPTHIMPGGAEVWLWSEVKRGLRATPAPVKRAPRREGGPRRVIDIKAPRGGRKK